MTPKYRQMLRRAKARQDKIKALLFKGMTIREVASKLRKDHRDIRKVARKNGWPYNSPLPEGRVMRVLKLNDYDYAKAGSKLRIAPKLLRSQYRKP